MPETLRYDDPGFRVAFDDLVLDRMRIAYNQAISGDLFYRMQDEYAEALSADQAVPPDTLLARTMTFETVVEPMLDQMICHLRADLLTERLATETLDVVFEHSVEFPFPANWYEHLRQAVNRWAFTGRRKPRWLRRLLFKRVKLRYHEKEVSETRRIRAERYAAFPAATIRTPPHVSGPIRVMRDQAYVDR